MWRLGASKWESVRSSFAFSRPFVIATRYSHNAKRESRFAFAAVADIHARIFSRMDAGEATISCMDAREDARMSPLDSRTKKRGLEKIWCVSKFHKICEIFSDFPNNLENALISRFKGLEIIPKLERRGDISLLQKIMHIILCTSNHSEEGRRPCRSDAQIFALFLAATLCYRC